ncbi:MAG: sporulation protein YabP [Lachnospiraceae bacterium]|nr:sporulation protein YabP [Lachnospiraceae bacterium]
MEEKKAGKPHQIVWKDRHRGSVTGVLDVLSFDEAMILLETELGMLTLKGKELHISRLSLDQGEVDMEGTIDSMVYSGSSPAKRGNLLKRMFQ